MKLKKTTETEITPQCTNCGTETQISRLRFLPEAEESVRKFALDLFCEKGEKQPKLTDGLNYDTLLCPDCYEKWLKENK